VARLRQQAGLTQDELAERLEITPRYLQKLENGMHAPSLPVLMKLRKKLGAGWSDVLEGL
jgi:transcriptional regulator with XRE-family HTH domain